MKSILCLLLCIAGSRLSYAQGTVSYQNFTVTPPVPGRVWTNSIPGAGFTQNTNGGVLAPAGYKVELMFAPLGGTNFTSARIYTNSSTGGGQFFDGLTVILPGIPAGTGSADTNNVQLFLRGWTGSSVDWTSAMAAGATLGQTAIFLNPTGGAGTALPANMVNWLQSNPLVLAPIVPEPSTLALGGLGVASLLLFRRRK